MELLEPVSPQSLSILSVTTAVTAVVQLVAMTNEVEPQAVTFELEQTVTTIKVNDSERDTSEENS